MKVLPQGNDVNTKQDLRMKIGIDEMQFLNFVAVSLSRRFKSNRASLIMPVFITCIALFWFCSEGFF